MKNIRPIWMQDYRPGTHLYTRNVTGGLVNDGIVWFESLQEKASFVADHVLMVVDQFRGIESSVKGVEYCDLAKYFDNPSIQVVCREPLFLTDAVAQQALAYGAKLEETETPYDYTGLVLGFPLMILTGFSKWIKPLRKLPVPFHTPRARVCSAFVADCMKHTTEYANIKLYREWHVSRITPVLHWNYFPYKPFRFDKIR